MNDVQLAEEIREYIEDFVLHCPINRLPGGDGPVVAEPLVGFGDGYDPVIDRFKEVVGKDHRSPAEAWLDAYPCEEPPEPLSIIGFILPFSDAVRSSNRNSLKEPSWQWLVGKLYGDAILGQLKTGLAAFFREKGIYSVIPSRSASFQVRYNGPTGPVSSWSERHYCFVAGLGSFGLSRGLITEKGVAMRCGSIIAGASLPRSPRPQSHTANCLFLTKGTCGTCMKRCPAGAITPAGKDNMVCKAYLDKTLGPMVLNHVSEEEMLRIGLGKNQSLPSCGLCQTGVPCEARIPQ